MPHAAAGVAHVAGIPRDDVHVHMRHGLPGGGPGVEPHVVAIRLGRKPLIEQPFCFAHELHERRLLVGRALEERWNDPPRDHEHVPGRHRKPVVDRERERIRADPIRLRNLYKW